MEENEIQEGGIQSFAESMLADITPTPSSSLSSETEPKKDDDPALTVDDVEKQLQLEITGQNPFAEKINDSEPAAPAETTDAKPEETNWWEKPSDKLDQEDTPLDDWKQKYDELSGKVKAYEEDELINLHLKFKNTEGYDFRKLVESFKQSDRSNESLESLYEEYLTSSGKDRDTIDNELYKLESKTELEREQLKADLLNKIGTKSDGNPYVEYLEAQEAKAREEYDQYSKLVAESQEKAQKFLTGIVGKDIAGFKVDKSVAKSVWDSFSDKNFYTDKDGKPDVVKETMGRIWQLYGPSIVKAAIEAERSKLIDQRTRPSLNNAPSSMAPPVADPRSKATQDFESFMGN